MAAIGMVVGSVPVTMVAVKMPAKQAQVPDRAGHPA